MVSHCLSTVLRELTHKTKSAITVKKQEHEDTDRLFWHTITVICTALPERRLLNFQIKSFKDTNLNAKHGPRSNTAILFEMIHCIHSLSQSASVIFLCLMEMADMKVAECASSLNFSGLVQCPGFHYHKRCAFGFVHLLTATSPVPFLWGRRLHCTGAASSSAVPAHCLL